MDILIYGVIVISAYFIGSIPVGLLYSLARGFDIRTIGSGNIGSTNVSRKFGFFGGFLPVFLLDGLKGALPVIAVRIFGVTVIAGDLDLSMMIVGFVALFGNIFSIYLKFKGGKGVATAAGFLTAVAPFSIVFTFLFFVAFLLSSRLIRFIAISEERALGFFKNIQHSVGISSLASAIFFPIVCRLISPERVYLFILGLVITVVIFYTHRSNIKKCLKKKNNTD